MSTEQSLEQIVQQLEDMVESTVVDSKISSPDLRRVLSFLAKVVQVVDQAFQDVFTVLIEFKYLTAEDYRSGRLRELRKDLDLLLARSRYRDAEEICSRLHHLRTQYESQISPLVSEPSYKGKWYQVFWLLEEREGRIIMLIHDAISDLNQILESTDETQVSVINATAATRAEAIRGSLSELRSLSNKIMGLSGQPGFLELTNNRQALLDRAHIFINKGEISMTRDTYSAGQVGAMGPGAHADHMTFQQIWNQQGGNINLSDLAVELSKLRNEMRREASSAEHDEAIGQIAAAETAAAKGDGPSALEHLKSAGKWAFDVATKIGIGVATTALKTALGL